MAKFNRERAKAELGWTDAQIDAYLSSSQARLDSAGVQAPAGGGTDPLGMVGGMASGAVDAIGGPKTLIGGGAVAGVGGMLARHLMKNRGQAVPAAPVATATPQATSASDERIREAKAMKAEADARAAAARADAAEARARPPEPAPKRTTQKRTPKPKRTKRPPAAVPDRTTKPGSGPAATPEQYKEIKARKQPGVSKRELAARAKGLAAAKGNLAPTDDLATQLERSLAAEQVMTSKGIPQGGARVPLRAGLRRAIGGGGGALGLLLTLLDSGSIPDQMADTDSLMDEVYPERALLRQRTRPTIY